MTDSHSQQRRPELSYKQGLLESVSGDTAGQRWIRRHIEYQFGDCCLIWPFPRVTADYPAVCSPKIRVHRLMCEYRNGPPPSPTHEAGHTCGRGEDGCVNPQHMIWQTHSENQLLRRLQQTGPAKRYKLTPAQVDDIRALKGRATIADIAIQFGVSENNIKFIFAGKIWKTPSSLMRRELTSEEVRAIRATPWQVKTARQWSAELGVPRTVIDRVRSGITYKWVEDQEQTA